MPNVAEEDDRRLHRERDRLIAERGQHVNRIKGNRARSTASMTTSQCGVTGCCGWSSWHTGGMDASRPAAAQSPDRTRIAAPGAHTGHA